VCERSFNTRRESGAGCSTARREPAARRLDSSSVVACLGIACLAACQRAEPAASSKHDPGSVAVIGTSERFRVLDETPARDSDSGAWTASEEPLLQWLQLADAAFTERFGAVPLPSSAGRAGASERALRDVVLAGTDYWPRLTCEHDYDGLAARGAAAFFSRACGKVHVQRNVTTARTEDLRAALIHEAVHQRVARQGFPVLTGPGAWVTEGLSLYLECLDERGRIDLQRSRRLAEARSLFRSGRLAPLSAFLAMSARELDALGQERVQYPWRHRIYERRVSLHHTQAFAVMAYLHRRRIPELPDLVRAGLESGLTLESLERHLGLTPDEIEREYEDSFRALSLAGVDY